MRRGRVLPVGVLMLVLLQGSALVARAQTTRQIDVFPGPHALAMALAQALPGDVLELHTGTYRDAVTITTPRIVLEPAGDGPIVIDGRCSDIATIAVRADDVVLQGPITVFGGRFYDVTYDGVGAGTLTGFTLRDSCHGTFGVQLQASGAILVSSNVIGRFAGGGIELFNITDTGTGHMLITSNRVTASGAGISVEQSSGGGIQLVGNRLNGNQFSGIQVMVSSGIEIKGNTTRSDGTYGIELDPDSTNNLVVGNVAMGNTFDLANLGGSNCFKRNRYQTSQGVIGC